MKNTKFSLKLYVLMFLVLSLVATSSLLIGMRSAINMDSLFFLTRKIKSLVVPPALPTKSDTGQVEIAFNNFEQLTSYPGKTEIKKPRITDKTIVAVVFGQSNAGNHLGQKYRGISGDVVNYFDGKFYFAEDPLLGATGSYGGVWTLTANKLLTEKIADKVILIPAGIGGSPIREWRNGGKFNGMLKAKLSETKSNGLAVTHFLWHQGESDNPNGKNAGTVDQYKVGLREVIALTKDIFPNSKFFVARASRCAYFLPPSAQLTNAQSEMAKDFGVFLGPNTDDIGLEDRFDRCHLSASGIERHSDGWVSAIKATQK